MGHTESLESNGSVLFNAQIGTNSDPIEPLSGSEEIFTADRAGSFYYVCTIPGHIEKGMWGRVEIVP